MENNNKLVFIISKVEKFQKPSKKALQKLIYLIERKGVNLGYNYSIHYYGPYSANLDFAIHSLQMQGLIDIVQDGMTHRIQTTELYDIEEGNHLTESEIGTINNVLDKFGSMSAFDLELITTTDYVAREIQRSKEMCNIESIVEGVLRIKGDKISIDKIKQAIDTLTKNGYLFNNG